MEWLRFDLGLPWGKATEYEGKALVPELPANSGQACEQDRKSWQVEVLTQDFLPHGKESKL